MPFFKLLKGQEKFKWTEEANAAHEDLKQHLQSLPVLIAPAEGENLPLYIAAIMHVVSTTIIIELPH